MRSTDINFKEEYSDTSLKCANTPCRPNTDHHNVIHMYTTIMQYTKERNELR